MDVIVTHDFSKMDCKRWYVHAVRRNNGMLSLLRRIKGDYVLYQTASTFDILNKLYRHWSHASIFLQFIHNSLMEFNSKSQMYLYLFMNKLTMPLPLSLLPLPLPSLQPSTVALFKVMPQHCENKGARVCLLRKAPRKLNDEPSNK
ncbi:hypothetical protein Tcan_13355 [Toxocara canis]|uniref:Uncharacterized protein n=1 Tax=Toxocara canis TaxID=6265 RepID=A0A0B2VHY4_TOXCA|nr:hypothetical protein Tcan_13355 [Toxocara canis]